MEILTAAMSARMCVFVGGFYLSLSWTLSRYTMKLHENNTRFAKEFQNDIQLLRAKVKSVDQTVHDNRKKLMKENLMTHRQHIRGLFSLRKLKIGDRLVKEDLNLHLPPKHSKLRILGIEL